LAEVYRLALKQAKEGVEVVNQATEIKLRAERRAGSLLRAKKASGDPVKTIDSNRFPPGTYERLPKGSLKDFAITKKQSSQWQKLATITPEKFEATISNLQRDGGELSRAKVLKENRPEPKVEKKTIEINIDPTPHPDFHFWTNFLSEIEAMTKLEILKYVESKINYYDKLGSNGIGNQSGSFRPQL